MKLVFLFTIFAFAAIAKNPTIDGPSERRYFLSYKVKVPFGEIAKVSIDKHESFGCHKKYFYRVYENANSIVVIRGKYDVPEVVCDFPLVRDEGVELNLVGKDNDTDGLFEIFVADDLPVKLIDVEQSFI